MNLKIPALVAALLVLGAFMGAATKVDLDSIEVSLSDKSNDTGTDSLVVNVGTTFYAHINLVNPDKDQDSSDVEIVISVGDVVVYDKTKSFDFVEGADQNITIKSDDFSQDDLWQGNLMAYSCGRKTLKVAVSGDIKAKRTANADIKYQGDKLNLEVTPSKPKITDNVKVHVTDDSGDDLSDINVRFTLLANASQWSKDDQTYNSKTNSDGIKQLTLTSEFTESPYGTYQIDVWEKDGSYCKETASIDASHSLTITSIDPSSPTAGQNIKAKVSDETGSGVAGAQVTVSTASGPLTFTTDAGGASTFHIDDVGTFEVIASKDGYADSPTKTVKVMEKGSLKIDINPGSQEVGKDVAITVSGSDGNALTNAKVTISRPDGVIEDPITTDKGKITYTAKLAGTYKLKANAPLYTETKDEFSSYNTFKATVSGSLEPGADTIVTVLDADSKPVYGATVSVKGASISGTTDNTGKYTFTLTDPKEYSILVKKDSFQDVTVTAIIKGSLNLKISSKDLKVGDTLEYVLRDGQGNPITATLTLTKPSGDKEVISDAYKPDAPGDYTLIATKNGYDSSSEGFTVSQFQLTLSSKLENGKIVVTATSDQQPIASLPVSFDLGDYHQVVKTDSSGTASLDAKNLTGNVSIGTTDPSYVKTTIVQVVKPSENSSMLLIILAALVIIVIAILAFTTRGQGKRKEKGRLYRTAGSSLDGRY